MFQIVLIKDSKEPTFNQVVSDQESLLIDDKSTFSIDLYSYCIYSLEVLIKFTNHNAIIVFLKHEIV